MSPNGPNKSFQAMPGVAHHSGDVSKTVRSRTRPSEGDVTCGECGALCMRVYVRWTGRGGGKAWWERQWDPQSEDIGQSSP